MEKFRKNRRKVGVYSILCAANMKMYIGSSKYIAKRWANHRDSFRRGVNQGNMQADYDKYGEGSFIYTLLESCEGLSEEDMLVQEECWVRRYNTTNVEYGYNIQLPTLGVRDRVGNNRNIRRGKPIYRLVDGVPILVDRTEYSDREMNDIRSVCYYWENAQKGGTNTIGTRRYKGDVHVWAHCYDAEFDYTSYIKPRKVRSRKEKVVKEPISMAERNLGRKEMEVTNISTGEILVYPSMSEAIRVLGIRQNKIQECMVGKRKSHKGYTFRYTGKCDRAIS